MTGEQAGRRVAIISMITSSVLGAVKIFVGLLANSTAVVSDGIESSADVLASGIVLFGLTLAAKPPDAEHPYGHGRYETLAGLAVGAMLGITGLAICYHALRTLGIYHHTAAFAIWPLIGSIVVKGVMSATKFHFGRRIGSEALVADGWNDTMDIISGATALIAVGLTIWNAERFRSADHYGAVGVGLIVVFLGIRVVWETAAQLVDVMPPPALLDEVRRVALSVPGALAIEKCRARKTGLKYHVDLHLEVDPSMAVRDSHLLGHEVRDRILNELDWVADVLVHVEPHATATIESGKNDGESGNRPAARGNRRPDGDRRRR